jgi:transcriptional regulator with XRE-family HTH domain
MLNFSQRLESFLKEKGISQSEAARRCDLKQQTISYILKNNLTSSKLAPKIAEGLNIRLDWLVHGEGVSDERNIIEIPLISNYKMLKSFVTKNDVNFDSFVYMDKYIGLKSFAYLYRSNVIIVCYDPKIKDIGFEYLNFIEEEPLITNEKKREDCFVVLERRIRHEDF